MTESREHRFVFLLSTDRPAAVPVVQDALRAAGIPFTSGVQSAPSPQVVFSVPEARVDEARAVVAQYFGTGPLSASEEPEPEPQGPDRAVFPWGPVRVVLSLVLIHLAIVFAVIGADPTPGRLAAAGALVTGAGIAQPWRLVSHLVLHADPAHVFWNGVSMLVFAVPLLLDLGYGRAAAVYVASGIAGGLAALATTEAGTLTLGSSGAVAGLFGAWLALTVRRARRAPLTRRALVRAIGIGMLVLPSLIPPTTSAGPRVSVPGHLGGLALGLCLGSLVPDPKERA